LNYVNKQARPVVLVTGAARRIGAVIAQYLHEVGFRVAIHCHKSYPQALALAQELNQQRADSAAVFQADLMIKEATTRLLDETIQWAGQLNVLVNNASVFIKTPVDMSEADACWDVLFTTNVKAPFWLSNAAYPHLKRQQGCIVNITDIHAASPLKGYAVYCQSKAALTMQTKALARAFAPEIRVNAVAPGAIAWPEDDNALNSKIKQKIIEEIPLQRHGEPIFIAQAVLALVNNPYITGQILSVDGGRSLE
jgi:pteridine reductase